MWCSIWGLGNSDNCMYLNQWKLVSPLLNPSAYSPRWRRQMATSSRTESRKRDKWLRGWWGVVTGKERLGSLHSPMLYFVQGIFYKQIYMFWTVCWLTRQVYRKSQYSTIHTLLFWFSCNSLSPPFMSQASPNDKTSRSPPPSLPVFDGLVTYRSPAVAF